MATKVWLIAEILDGLDVQETIDDYREAHPWLGNGPVTLYRPSSLQMEKALDIFDDECLLFKVPPKNTYDPPPPWEDDDDELED